MSAWLIGSSLHTTLGFGVEAHQRALRGALVPPERVTIPSSFGPQTVGRYSLSATARDAESRFREVLDRNVDSALQDADLSAEELRDAAVFVGSSSLDMCVHEARYRRELERDPDAVAIRGGSLGGVAAYVLERAGARGPDFTFSTGCTSSANALASATSMIECGAIRSAIVVGVELHNDITALGFRGLQLLTDEVMRPFDRERRGLALGEACAIAVLSKAPRRTARWRVLGGANACDAYNMSTSNPDGLSIAAVMQDALAAAGVTSQQIAAIKVHGAASLRSDEAEVAGLARVFERLPPLCALKPWLGHTFGACGLAELLLFIASLDDGALPATPGVCAIESDLGVTLNQARSAPGDGEFLLNYFGFGGSNTSLVLSRRS